MDDVGRIAPSVSVRGPGWVRELVPIWAFLTVLGLVRVGWRAARGSDDSTAELLAVSAVLIVTGLVIWRAGRLATVAVGERLLVRNWTRELRLQRDTIAAFELKDGRMRPQVVAVLVDGRRVGLDSLGAVTRRANRLEHVEGLQRWLADRRSGSAPA